MANEADLNIGIYKQFTKTACEEIAYAELLDGFTQKMVRLNKKSIEGKPIGEIKAQIKKLKEDYGRLAGLGVDFGSFQSMKMRDRVLNTDLVHEGWIHCPKCGKKLYKAHENTKLDSFPLWCKRCHHSTNINL